MLVLTRKKKESIRVGDDIAITLLGIEGDQVKLWVSMSRSILIYTARKYTSLSNRKTGSRLQATVRFYRNYRKISKNN
ncbi:carbon storage regulator, CsrA [Marinococcus luteus]|uniref:Carbon storage regulator, CsrA n=1 Tax=Marinococcus luteus TaxID=1122204 RepID=A0A1H2UA81_9BACI|nr:carbon storage regulator, CsrA [Marinococcus luteus]